MKINYLDILKNLNTINLNDFHLENKLGIIRAIEKTNEKNNLIEQTKHILINNIFKINSSYYIVKNILVNDDDEIKLDVINIQDKMKERININKLMSIDEEDINKIENIIKEKKIIKEKVRKVEGTLIIESFL